MTSETTDEILLKLQAAQTLSSEDPETAELFLRSALRDAEALGHSSPTCTCSWRSSSTVSGGPIRRSRR